MATKSTAQKAASNGVDAAAQMAGRASDALKDNAEHVQAAASDAAKRATKEAETLVKSGASFVQKNPGVALAGAVGVGVILGLALNRRS